jgi:tetratricopeptide (TPR) repeat protein
VFYAEESARNIPILEARMAGNPASPLFARLASYYLAEGRHDRAVELCLQGLKHFPEYATGRLVLGRALEGLGRTVEALLEYRKVARALPDNATVAALLRAAEQRDQDSFRAFAEESARRLRDRTGDVTFESFVADEPAPAEGTAEFVLRRMQMTQAAPPPRQASPAPAVPPAPPARGGPRIVTATLAEIYASQGEYREALEAYKRLREQNPADAPLYERRIAELTELARVQHADEQR